MQSQPKQTVGEQYGYQKGNDLYDCLWFAIIRALREQKKEKEAA